MASKIKSGEDRVVFVELRSGKSQAVPEGYAVITQPDLDAIAKFSGATLVLQATAITNSAGTSLVNVTEVADSVTLGSSGGTITHTFASGYDYWMEISGALPLTDGATVYLRFNDDSTATAYWWELQYSGTSLFDASDDAFDLSATQGVGNFVADEYLSAHLNLDMMHSTSLYKHVHGTVNFKTAANAIRTGTFGGGWNSTSAVTSIEVYATGGTPHFASGTMTLYRSARP